MFAAVGLRDRNSYKNNTARTPAFHTWAVQWKSSPSFKGSFLDSGGTRPSYVSQAPQLKREWSLWPEIS